MLNNRHPVVWGELALLCLKQERFDEATQSITQAYKLELAEPGLLLELSVAMYEVGHWSDSEAAVRKALLYGPSAPAHKALGNALMEQHAYEEALASYKDAIADASCTEEIARWCKKNASHLLHFHLNRPAEAEAL